MARCCYNSSTSCVPNWIRWQRNLTACWARHYANKASTLQQYNIG